MAIVIALVLLDSCDQEEVVQQGNDSPCKVISSPSYFGTTQTYEYDQGGFLTTRKYDFGFPGYGPFTQSVDRTKSFYMYTSSAGKIEVTDVFTGGTGNLYEGLPDRMIHREHHTYSDGRMEAHLGPDTLLTFQYDDQKRLSTVTYHHKLISTGNVYDTYSRQLYHTVLELTYDANDNVIQLKQYQVFREGVYNVNTPSSSYFVYKQSVLTEISVTYDDKPSPFTSILKYWKFLQGDWGYATNSNWQAIIASLSKNNPLAIKYSIFRGAAVQTITTLTYTYNDHGFPIDSYTYTCQ